MQQLYFSLYGEDDGVLSYFFQMLERCFQNRNPSLRQLDEVRAKDPGWYRGNDLLGMMLYVDAFAGNLVGVMEKLPYLTECGVNYLHLMPLLETPKDRSDGGYAVSDFRRVQPELGTMAKPEFGGSKNHERPAHFFVDVYSPPPLTWEKETVTLNL